MKSAKLQTSAYAKYCYRAEKNKMYAPTLKEYENYNKIQETIDELVKKDKNIFFAKDTSITICEVSDSDVVFESSSRLGKDYRT